MLWLKRGGRRPAARGRARRGLGCADDNDRRDLQTQNLIADTVQDEFQNGYILADARLGIAPRAGVYRVELFVTDLFDKKFIKDAGNTGDALGLPTFIAGEPRFYGVALSMRFGGK